MITSNGHFSSCNLLVIRSCELVELLMRCGASFTGLAWRDNLDSLSFYLDIDLPFTLFDPLLNTGLFFFFFLFSESYDNA